MTERQLTAGEQELVRHSQAAPIAAAHMAAMSVYKRLGPSGQDKNPTSWVTLGQAHETDHEIAIVETLAPFVRAQPGAPTEALYIHARMSGVHRGRQTDWPTLPIHIRVAWETFHLTLTVIDRAVAAELAAVPVEAKKPRAVPLDETILEPMGDRFESVSYAKKTSKKKSRRKQ